MVWTVHAQMTDVEVPTAPGGKDLPYITFFPTPQWNDITPEDLLKYIRRKQQDQYGEPDGRDTYKFWRWFHPRERVDDPPPVWWQESWNYPHYNVLEGHPGVWRFTQDKWTQDLPVIEQKDMWGRELASRMPFSRVATALKRLVDDTDDKIRTRAGRCGAAILPSRSDKKAGIFTFKVGCREDWSTRGGWIVKFKFVFDEEDIDEKKGVPDWTKMDVLVSCNCPAWRYWGSQWHAVSKDYAEDPGLKDGYGGGWNRERPTSERDSGKNLLCKHAVAAGWAFLRYI